MKNPSLLILLVCGAAVTGHTEDTNAAPKTTMRIQRVVRRADSGVTNASPPVATNSVATTTNAPRYQDRLQTIIRRGTNQPALPPPANKP